MILKTMYLLAICMLAAAQITSAPEFKTGCPVFQKDRGDATVDGTSHSSAEKAQINADISAKLKQLAGYAGGSRMIESSMMPEAESWFRQLKLPIGAAVTQFFKGKEAVGVQALIGLAKTSPTPRTVLPFLDETAATIPSLMPAAYDVIQPITGKHPESSDGYYYQARLLQELPTNDGATAVTLLEKSIALAPWATTPRVEVSRLQTTLEDRRAAIPIFEKVLALDHDLSVAHYHLASLSRVTGQTETARTHMDDFQKLESKEK